jgi:hypothetical protein
MGEMQTMHLILVVGTHKTAATLNANNPNIATMGLTPIKS